MKKNKKYIIILNILTLILLIVITCNTKTLFIEKVFKDGYSMIIKVTSIPINYLKEEITKNNYKGNLYNENILLKENISELNYLKKENEQLKSDIASLKKILNIDTLLSEYNRVSAAVIDRNLGYWYDNLTIDKGSQDGIKENQIVVTNDGLVGYIETTSFFSSTVKLITSNLKNKISIKIQNLDGYVYGVITDYKDGFFLIEGISEDIEVSSTVTTAGLGNNYPEGIYIGEVSEIKKDNFDISSIIKVKSNIDYDLIKIVNVLSVKE